MNNLITKNNIASMIYEIRGVQVMLDSDLAKLYECKNGTKSINLAVNRNKDRFPSDFNFQLTKEEYYNLLRFQSETLELKQGNYSKYLPYVFTEQGVAMLATIIKTNVASNVSITIMRAFVAMKKYLSTNLIQQKYINDLVIKDHNKILTLQKSFDKLNKEKEATDIYFNGQIYDAYSKILDILKEAKEEIIIIDSYADKEVLDIIRKIKTKVIIITKKDNLLSNKDIEKYNKQYSNLKVIYDNTFHDRYFILDKKIVYHCGTSLNRIGYKTFSITKISDKNMIITLLTNVNNNVNSK